MLQPKRLRSNSSSRLCTGGARFGRRPFLGAEEVRRVKGLFGNGKVIAALVVPGIAVMVFSLVVPIGFSAYYSLTDWAGFGKFHMVGLENYREIFTADPVFYRALMNAF